MDASRQTYDSRSSRAGPVSGSDALFVVGEDSWSVEKYCIQTHVYNMTIYAFKEKGINFIFWKSVSDLLYSVFRSVKCYSMVAKRRLNFCMYFISNLGSQNHMNETEKHK